MSAIKFSVEEAKNASIRLTEGDKGHHAIYLSVVAYRAARRAGTASTKSRAEVAGSGKKLWGQKGTGNARMGSRRSPIWRGGGVVWGPKPRDYSKKVNSKVRTLALRSSLTARIADNDVLFVPAINIADGRTKSFLKVLESITNASKVVIVGNFDDLTVRSARNLSRVRLISPAILNAEHILDCEKLILTASAVEILAQRTSDN